MRDKLSMEKSERQILSRLEALGRPKMLVKMVHYAINTENAPGVPLLDFRRFASGIGGDETLALTLWRCSVHETRLLATVIVRPTETDRRLADILSAKVRSWDLCYQYCNNLFRKCHFARHLIVEWRLSEK